jgi:CBS domain-containing protein
MRFEYPVRAEAKRGSQSTEVMPWGATHRLGVRHNLEAIVVAGALVRARLETGPLRIQRAMVYHGTDWGRDRLSMCTRVRRDGVGDMFGKKIDDVMTTRPRAVMADTKVVEAAAAMRSDDVGVLPVVDSENRLVGVVTDRDIVTRLVAEGGSANTTNVGSILTEGVVAVSPDDDVDDARKLMETHQLRRLPVLSQEGELVGLVGHSDVARVLRAGKTDELVEEITKETSEPRV